MTSEYRKERSFDTRLAETERVKRKYPERIPVLVERVKGSKLPDIAKRKFLVPMDLTVGQFQYAVRREIAMKPEQAMFIFVNNVLPPTAALMSTMYQEYKNEDGYLYVTYDGENTFGIGGYG
jgi:GABA(A) receptor-associated protein